MTIPNKGYEDGFFRTPAYKRVDMGVSYELIAKGDAIHERSFLKYVKSIWLGVDVFNLLDMKNVNSYYWITRADQNQFAIPNYLTGRQINARLIVDF